MFHKAGLMDQPLVFHPKVKSSGYNKAPRQDLKHWIQWKNNFHLLQLEFTATQIVYKLVVFIRLVMFFFSEEPYLYLKQTLRRSLLKKGQTEICESHHFKCFKKIIGTKFLPFFILRDLFHRNPPDAAAAAAPTVPYVDVSTGNKPICCLQYSGGIILFLQHWP